MSTNRFQGLRYLCLGLLLGGVVLAGEHDRLPAKAAAAIKAAFPTARIEEVEREREDGVVVYEVELQIGRKEIEVEVDAAGVIGSVEEELRIADAPKAVLAACKKMYPGAEVDEVERCEIRGVFLYTGFAALAEPRIVYEVELETTDDKEVELVLDAAGKVLEKEVDDDDDDDDDDGEHHDDDDDDGEHGKHGHDDDDD